MKLTKIISGGQTGADQGGLRAAKRLGLQTGGVAPKGWRTEVGPAPWLAEFGLVESSSADYQARTKANVEASNGTVIFGNHLSAGSRLTIRLCKEIGRPHIIIRNDHFDITQQDCDEFAWWLGGVLTLNIAGNRESKLPGIGAWVEEFLVQAIEEAGWRT